MWIHDVFAFGGIPAAWNESLVWATDASVRSALEHERKKLHRIGDKAVIVMLKLEGGDSIELAARREHKANLLGPFAAAPPGTAAATRARSSEPSYAAESHNR